MTGRIRHRRARAGEYDGVCPEREDLREPLTVMDGLLIVGDTLEPACGTPRNGPVDANAREPGRAGLGIELDASYGRHGLAALRWSADIRLRGNFFVGVAELP
ncbi:hypothetical protein ACI2L1_01115 [Streptomyces sp. NPDC019531]|uniref:hypothetical protein n=1 Tax=Streptomyces sp. NPDC019531 TaxID=3365062 RepID=UPI00384C9366